jgi:hypothetical protein
LTRRFDPDIGPVHSANIYDPLSRRPEFESAKSQRVDMLIDTGASDSSISGDIIDRLGLSVFGLYRIHSWAQERPSYQHLADIELELDVPYEIRDWGLFRFETRYNAIQGIIGRDILRRARFELNGPKSQFTIEF